MKTDMLAADMARALLRSAFALEDRIARTFIARGLPGRSRAWIVVLIEITDGVHQPASLIGKLGVSKQAFYKTLTVMEDRGFIEFERREPGGGHVTITDKGAQFLREGVIAIAEVSSEMSAQHGRKQWKAMAVTLDKLTASE